MPTASRCKSQTTLRVGLLSSIQPAEYRIYQMWWTTWGAYVLSRTRGALGKHLDNSRMQEDGNLMASCRFHMARLRVIHSDHTWTTEIAGLTSSTILQRYQLYLVYTFSKAVCVRWERWMWTRCGWEGFVFEPQSRLPQVVNKSGAFDTFLKSGPKAWTSWYTLME